MILRALLFALIVNDLSNSASPTQILRFAQTYDKTGPSPYLGVNYRDGTLAAFEEANENDELDGIQLVLDSVDDANVVAIALANVDNFLKNTTNLIAFIGTAGTPTSLALKEYLPDNMPLIAPYSGAVKLLRKPFTPKIINLRPSYYDECIAIADYLVYRRQLSRVGVFYCNSEYGRVVFSGMQKALNMYILEPYVSGIYDKYNPSNITAALRNLLLDCHAIVIVHYTIQVGRLMLQLKKLWPNVLYFTLSPAGGDYLASVLYRESGFDTKALKNVYNSNDVPLPLREGYDDVPEFEFQGRFYQNIVNRSESDISYTAMNMEGYLAGRLVIDTIARMKKTEPITTAGFVDTLFQMGNYNLGPGVKCGSFYLPNEINDDGCNQCMKTVFISSMNDTSMTVDKISNGITKFSTCGFLTTQKKYVTFGNTIPARGALTYRSKQINAGIRAAFYEINRNGGISGFNIRFEDHVHETEDQAKDNLRMFLNSPDALGLIGLSDREMINMSIPIVHEKENAYLVGGFSTSSVLRDPFEEHHFNFLPSVCHEFAVAITYLYETYRIARVGLLTSDDIYGTETRKELVLALSAKRLTIYIEGRLSDIKKTDEILTQMEKEAKSGAPQVLVLDGKMQNVALFLAKAKVKWPDTIYVVSSDVGTDDFVQMYGIASSNATHIEEMGDAIDIDLTNSDVVPSTVSYESIYLIQSFAHPQNISRLIITEYQNAIQKLDEGWQPTFYSLYGYLVALFFANLLVGEWNSDIHSIGFVSKIYSSNTFFRFSDMICGPIYATENFTDGCSSCSQHTHLFPLMANGSINSQTIVSMFHNTCHYTPNDNIVFETPLRLFLVMLGLFSILIFFIVVTLLILYRKHFLIMPTFKFALLSCVGCLCIFLSAMMQYGIPNDSSCKSSLVLTNVSFVFIFGPLFAKTRRIIQIFNNQKLRRMKITDKQVLLNFSRMLLLFTAFFICWGIVSPPRVEEKWTTDGIRYESCISKYYIFPFLNKVIQLVSYGWGAFLCYRINGISGEWSYYNESKEIGMCIYIGAFFLFLTFLLETVIEESFTNDSIACLLSILNALAFMYIMYFTLLRRAYNGVTRAEYKVEIEMRVKGDHKQSSTTSCGSTNTTKDRKSIASGTRHKNLTTASGKSSAAVWSD